MTPAARFAASIGILDQIGQNGPVEKILTTWARKNRYAGSGDRAAIRDIVFDIVRKMRSCQAAGGGTSGRAMVLGYLALLGQDPGQVFTGDGYAPAPLTEGERTHLFAPEDWPDPVKYDYPDWLDGPLDRALGKDKARVMALMQDRAPVFVRVNPKKATLSEAQAALAEAGIGSQPHPIAPFALLITSNPRRITQTECFLAGAIELQDGASQAVISTLDLPAKGRILDTCAGGGGKALAIAALTDAEVLAYDALPARMTDLPKRSKRAGAHIPVVDAAQRTGLAPYALVLCDVPCSGSGTWRRAPAAKWDFTAEKLDDLVRLQREILSDAADMVAENGALVYVTCSMLDVENQGQVDYFLHENNRFTLEHKKKFSALDGGDGMFVATFRRI